eukprot:TRINITY_DN9569_c0_g1_i1.p1 TRINITY_DN9569_c0_g1~~TRINITY_DN9569_c0_g1_i1.p1  ORF type:complete len:173 (-),score=49.75 TRINITY_DN9569_c0_g1_i1:24-542(-)
MSNEPFFSTQHSLLMLQLVSFGILFGTLVWHSFIAGIIMFKSMPLRSFGDLQTALFPPYFILSAVCGSVLLLSFFGLHSVEFSSLSRPLSIQLGCLLIIIVFSVLQHLWIGPKTTFIMHARRKADDEGDKKKLTELSKKFGMWHGISSSVNLAVVIAALVYALYFVQHIQLV